MHHEKLKMCKETINKVERNFIKNRNFYLHNVIQTYLAAYDFVFFYPSLFMIESFFSLPFWHLLERITLYFYLGGTSACP